MNRTEKIKLIRAGGNQNPNIEHPLFWQLIDNMYVADNFKLSIEEFEKLQKRQPCYVGWIEEKTY